MDEFELKGKNLLVVDDENDLRDIVASELEYMGAKVFQAENISVAQDILSKEKIDLIVSDIRMPGGTGIDLLKVVKNKNVDVPPIILITGFADITMEDAFNQGAEALINKPFKLEELIRSAYKLTEPKNLRYLSTTKTTKDIDFQTLSPMASKISSGEFALGRGGLTLILDSEYSKIDIGESVRFSISFKDTQFTGAAVCRWWKHHDHLNNKVTVGLEFVQLSFPTLDYMLKYWESNSSVSFIPSLG